MRFIFSIIGAGVLVILLLIAGGVLFDHAWSIPVDASGQKDNLDEKQEWYSIEEYAKSLRTSDGEPFGDFQSVSWRSPSTAYG